MSTPTGSRLSSPAVLYGVLASLAVQASATSDSSKPKTGHGYSYGQAMPVTCLNRTIDSGEHITDPHGKLQYIPFPTCNETQLPLALHYGIPETTTCTLSALPDDLYHLLEYYVHSDAPLTCRIPTAPLGSPSGDDDSSSGIGQDGSGELSDLAEQGPAYTPLTIAVQGTLQKSHLHIWSDLNVLLHSIGVDGGKKKSKKGDGYLVAGTAYSVPEFDVAVFKGKDEDERGEEEEEAAVAKAAREPWTAGHGTKVVRGEPLTFTFHVNWVEGGRGIGWPGFEGGEKGSGGLFSRVVFFVLAASVGALVAIYWERVVGRRRGWRGDGILGVPSRGKGSVGVTFGNGGKINGYGGYAGSGVGNGNGYGGFMTGKRD